MRDIPIILDRPRLLRFDHNAIAALERATGKGLFQILEEPPESFGWNLLMSFLWAGLLHEDRALRRLPPEEGIWAVGDLLAKAPGATIAEQMAGVQVALRAAILEHIKGEVPEKNLNGGTLSPPQPAAASPGA